MTQNSMDDLLKNSMEAEREIPFDESAWEALSDRIDRDRQRRLLLPWWWLLPGLLILMFLASSIFYLSNQLKHATDRIDALESQAQDILPLSIVDTCTETIIIHHYDTIYQPVIVEKIREIKPSREKLDSLLQEMILPYTKRAKEMETNNQLTAEAMPERHRFDTLTSLETNIGFPVSHSFVHAPKGAVVKKRKKSHFEIGWVYGLDHSPFAPSTLNARQDNTNDFMQYKTATFTGLRLAYGFSPNFQISLSPGIETIHYGSKSTFLTPYYEPALENYSIDSIGIQQKAWRIPLEMRYLPFTKSKWQPFLEAGIVAHAYRQATVKAHYTTDLPYIDPSYDLNQEYTFEALKINQVSMGLGLCHFFNRQVNVQIGGKVYSKLKPESLLQMQYALQGQIAFKF